MLTDNIFFNFFSNGLLADNASRLIKPITTRTTMDSIKVYPQQSVSLLTLISLHFRFSSIFPLHTVAKIEDLSFSHIKALQTEKHYPKLITASLIGIVNSLYATIFPLFVKFHPFSLRSFHFFHRLV